MCASLTIAMQNPPFIYTVIIHVAVWLQMCCFELPHINVYPAVLFIACGHTVFIKSCTCTAFVWYLLGAMMHHHRNTGRLSKTLLSIARNALTRKTATTVYSPYTHYIIYGMA